MVYARHLIIGTMLGLIVGCSLSGGPHSPQQSTRALSFAQAQGLPTDINVNITTPFRWRSAREGALNAMEGCAKVKVSGGAEALYVLLLCLPVNGVLGAVMGVLSEPSPVPVNVGELEHFLGAGRPQAAIYDYTVQEVRQSGIRVVEADSADVPSRVDAQLEVWLRSVSVDVMVRGAGMNVQLSLDIRVRMLEATSLRPLRMFNLMLESPVYSYQYWIGNDCDPVKAFVKSAAEQLVDQLRSG